MFSAALGDDAALCPLEPHQAAELAAFTERNRAHLQPWLPWAHTVTDTESARGLLQRYAERQAADTGRFLAIRQGGALVGGMLLMDFDTGARSCELGAWLAPEARGRGLVTRAATRVIDWAVEERGIVRVQWRVAPVNVASVAVARRLGMRHEGTTRSVFEMGGERHDLAIWAVLADEWRAARVNPHG
ncbi:GNAT family protein [Streptomyces sp. DSM 44915]|uniref:GNAT family protein n=1 Tax=Streptomyces chisholmiae TaxID=3075540 RepID=A0ABU2K133_9ACTN|nr:GNAT family protein [Streptomyces sp. DSM 44915]MDT0270158.1 GNAT family protein [Streptomyces sp. DSM 44915]